LHKTIGSLEEEIINRTAVTRSFYLKEIERLQGVIDRQQQAKSTGLWLVIETLETKFAEAQAEVERLRLVRDAASCIKHWHDSGEDGMVVSDERYYI
jgi:hypothetical protein